MIPHSLMRYFTREETLHADCLMCTAVNFSFTFALSFVFGNVGKAVEW